MADKKKASEILEEVANTEVEELNEIKANQKLLNKENLVSCGCTEIDLACSSTVYGAFIMGKYYSFVGNSTSGKTMLALHALAEMNNKIEYDDHDFIYDASEDGCDIDIEEMFGPVLYNRMKAPAYNEDGSEDSSVTVGQLFDRMESHLEAELAGTGNPFVWIEDSTNGLTTEADIKKANTNKKLREEDKDTEGTFGMQKAKDIHDGFKRIWPLFKRSKSIIFFITQDRADNGPGKMPGQRTYSGGDGIKFWATLQIWLKHRAKIDSTISGKKRNVGNKALVDLTKNRLTGQKHKGIPMEIYFAFGIDNLGGQIDYLLDEGTWTGKTRIDTNGCFKVKNKKKETVNLEPMPKQKLIEWIEGNDKEDGVLKVVQNTFDEVQQKIKTKFKRKKRYK